MPPASKRRRVAFALLAIAVVWGLVELTAVVAHRVIFGSGYALGDMRSARAQVIGAPGVDAATAERQRATELLVHEFPKAVHPYLGFVMNPEANSERVVAARDWGMPISEFGFFDDGPPVRARRDDTLVVGITGGSVAMILGYAVPDLLIDEIRALPGLGDRRVELVRLANPGYKQPQQLLALDFVLAQGGALDVLVNLDGVNELGFPVQVHGYGVHPIYPSDWNLLSSFVPSVEQQRAIGEATFLRGLRTDLATWFGGCWLEWSPAANVFWRTADRVLDGRIVRANAAALDASDTHQRYLATGPRFEGSTEDVVAFSIDVWARGSELLHQRCRARGIEYVHLLQPNQYAPGTDKPLTAEERAAAYDETHLVCGLVRRHYPELRARGAELADAGVGFHDLTPIYDGIEDAIYSDACCHVNQLGNEILARAVVRALAPALTAQAPPPRGTPVAIDPRTPTLTLDRPFDTAEIRIAGRLDDGSSRDVTYACDSFTSSDPTVARVDRWGVVHALRPGECRVTAQLGDRSCKVEVRVGFAPVVELDQRAPRRGDPKLRIDGDVGASVTLRLDPVPALQGWISVGVEPYRSPFCREWLYVDLAAAERIPVDPEHATYELPLRPELRGRTIYVQAVLVDPQAACDVRTSNALAITVAR